MRPFGKYAPLPSVAAMWATAMASSEAPLRDVCPLESVIACGRWDIDCPTLPRGRHPAPCERPKGAMRLKSERARFIGSAGHAETSGPLIFVVFFIYSASRIT